jgi:hypothetical protein
MEDRQTPDHQEFVYSTAIPINNATISTYYIQLGEIDCGVHLHQQGPGSGLARGYPRGGTWLGPCRTNTSDEGAGLEQARDSCFGRDMIERWQEVTWQLSIIN